MYSATGEELPFLNSVVFVFLSLTEDVSLLSHILDESHINTYHLLLGGGGVWLGDHTHQLLCTIQYWKKPVRNR